MVTFLPRRFVFIVGQGRPSIFPFLQRYRWWCVGGWLPCYVFREPGASCGIFEMRRMKGSPRRRVHGCVEEIGPISTVYTQLFHVVPIALMATDHLQAT